MPSGYTTALPNNVSFDVGVLYYSSTTVFGVSDGGLRATPTKEHQNIPFDNKRSKIQGLDRTLSDDLVISGEFIEISDALFSADLLEPGATPTTAGTPTTVTYTPASHGALFATGDYITNLVLELTRGDTKKVCYVVPVAYVERYEIISTDKNVVKVACEFHSRLSQSDAATSTDKASYKIEVRATS